VLGIVGGLASGKSTVARLLAERGARVVDADRIAHEVLEAPGIKQVLVEAFGRDILNGSGSVSRPLLAEKVFGHPELVERLNGIVHPPVIREVRDQVDRLRREGAVPLIVVDAALLLETGLDEGLCQALLFVDTPEELRRHRATALRQMSAGQFARRQEAQLPAEAKKHKATYLVTNAGPLKDLARQIEAIWPKLCRIGTGDSD
jgi:dephospho-CoA kinase